MVVTCLFSFDDVGNFGGFGELMEIWSGGLFWFCMVGAFWKVVSGGVVRKGQEKKSR